MFYLNLNYSFYFIIILIELAMFYFVYKIVSDFSSKFYRFIISASIAVIFIPLAFMLSYFLWILSLFIYIPTSFTSERWNSDPNQRFEISRSLIYGKHLKELKTWKKFKRF